MRHGVLHRGQYIDFDGDIYRVDAQVGSDVRLVREEDGEEIYVDLGDLPKAVGEPSMMMDPRFDPRLLNRLDRADRALVKFRSRAVLRIIGHADPDDPDYTLYDPETTTEPVRRRHQAEELRARDLPGRSENTLRNWVGKYRAGGLLALRELRACKPKSPYGTTDKRVLDVIDEVIQDATFESNKTDMPRLIKIREVVLDRHKDDEEPPVVQSERTLRRRLKTKQTRFYTTGSARSRRSVAKRPDHMFDRRPVTSTGEEVDADASPVDLAYKDSHLRARRCVLTIMLDIATRSIAGELLTDGSPTSQSNAFMLAKAMATPKALAGPVLPWTVDLSKFRWADGWTPQMIREAVATRPFIPPQRLHADNARDNRGHVFQSAADMLEVDLSLANPGTPTSKPEVERSFGTFWSMLAQDLPGYVSRSPEFRGEDFDVNELVDLPTLAAIVQAWIVIVWQNHPHEGLRDERYPGVVLTPNQMYDAMLDSSPHFPMALSEDELISFLQHKDLVCQPDGFHVGYHRYDSPDMTFRGELCPYTSGKWPVYFNRLNPAAAWVRPSKDAPFLQLDLMDQHDADKPFRPSVRAKAMHAAARLGVDKQPDMVRDIAVVIANTDDAVNEAAREDDRDQMNLAVGLQMGLPLPQPRPAGATVPPQLETAPPSAQPEPVPDEDDMGLFNPKEESW